MSVRLDMRAHVFINGRRRSSRSRRWYAVWTLFATLWASGRSARSRAPFSLAQSRKLLRKPCAVATRPGVSLFASTRRRKDVRTISPRTFPRGEGKTSVSCSSCSFSRLTSATAGADNATRRTSQNTTHLHTSDAEPPSKIVSLDGIERSTSKRSSKSIRVAYTAPTRAPESKKPNHVDWAKHLIFLARPTRLELLYGAKLPRARPSE